MSAVVEKGGDAPQRDRWASRWTFIIASVGSAVGLGNVWRFPYLNYKHGGGAFLIPYFFFLVATGLPMLQAELALGRLFQKGDVEAFGNIHRRARGVGAISAIGGFGVVTYYSSIIAWAAYFVGASFQWPFSWAVEDCEGNAECLADPKRSLPIPTSDSYFLDTVLRDNADSLKDGVARVISGPLFGCLLFTWIAAYFCIWKGVKSVGFAIKLTVYLPWILLAVMIIYNSTLDGAGDGVKAYIGEWDMSVLSNGAAWSDAAGQIFFTLGATLGIMSAYGSFAPSTTNIFVDNNLICFINCGTSLAAGFAVFSILGNMAYRQRALAAANPDLRLNICAEAIEAGDDCAADFDCSICGTDSWQDGLSCCGNVNTDNVARAGVMLAFSVYPATMQYLGKGGANVLSIMWFGTLWLLGIDSMFAMIEGVSTVITDTPRFAHLRKEMVALVTCMIGFICSIAFVTDIGLPLLDSFDHYILNYGLMVTGALEAYTVAWVWGWPEVRGRCGFKSAAAWTGGFTVASLLGTGIAGALHYELEPGVNIAVGFAIGVPIFVFSALASFLLRDESSMSFNEWFSIVVWSGSRNLRATFKQNPTPMETTMHIISFDFMIKYFCFPGLLGLFINQAVNDATQFDNGYENYPNWLHALSGVVVLGTMVFSLIIFFIYPQFWDVFGGDAEKEVHTDAALIKEEVKGDEQRNPYLPQLRTGDGWGNDT